MKKTRRKTIPSVTAIFIILSIAISMFALPNAKAQSSIKSYPLIDVVPNHCGVGQRVLINYGAINYLTTEADGWNVTITITKPDNTTETLTPSKTWSTGNAGTNYVPDQLGTYYLQTNFPQQDYRNVTYLAGQSDKIALVVEQQASPSYPWQPIPSEYWTRPADSQLIDWWSIMGSWLTAQPNLYAPYNQGPESAHILWSQPIGDMTAGITGGDTGNHGYENGDAYEGKWSGSIIISGVLYYNKFISGNPQQEVVAVDLHTGKTLWDKTLLTNLRIGFGQTIFWWSRNNRAAFSYLVCSSGTNYWFFDAHTGNLQFNMTDVPSGTNFYGLNGEILKYSLVNYGNTANPNWHLLQWNSSWVVTNGKAGMQESWGSQVLGVTYNATVRGYDKNVTVSALNTPGNTLPTTTFTRCYVGDKAIGSRVTQTQVNLWSISLDPANMGTLLYNTSWTPPADWAAGNVSLSGSQAGFVCWSQQSQAAVIWVKEMRLHYGFDLNTGKYMWTTTVVQNFEDSWDDSATSTHIIDFGELVSASVGGTVYAYNITNGKLMWTYNATDPYQESYISNNWWTVPVVATDGKLYIGSMEHSAQDPKPRGAPFFCLNATTGEEIWRINGAFRQTRWGGRGIIGDSIIATMDTYDESVYAIGKGPTSITISAPNLAAALGQPVVIKGTVMDISPGTQSDSALLRFPNGVPAVSDESQSDWMLYVYKQFTQPTNTTGVPVSIDAIDSNNNYVHVGTTKTDPTGIYRLAWVPPNAGNYTIFATFAGSKSYYGSTTEDGFTVMDAPSTTTTPIPVAVASMTDTYVIGSAIAIIIAVAIVGIAVVLVVRKRP